MDLNLNKFTQSVMSRTCLKGAHHENVCDFVTARLKYTAPCLVGCLVLVFNTKCLVRLKLL